MELGSTAAPTSLLDYEWAVFRDSRLPIKNVGKSLRLEVQEGRYVVQCARVLRNCNLDMAV